MIRAAFAAAKNLKRDFGEVENLQVSEKGPGDFVSHADIKAERMLRAELAPDKINLASFGNFVPHLHWHVIPRFADDPYFPGSIWSAKQRETPEAVLKSRRELAKGLPDAIRSGIADLA